jgi:hypothetical protein
MLVAACGGDEAPTPTATLPSPDALRDATVERLLALSSVRFEITHPGEGTDMGGGLLLTSVEGIAAFPDRAEMTAAGVISPAVVNFGIVQIAETTYFSGPFGDTWRIVEPGTLPFDFVAMHESVAHAIANATGLVVADGGKLDGAPIMTLSGTIASEDLRGLVPDAAEGRSLRVIASIRREDGLPIRVALEGPLIGADTETMVRHLDLSDFDAPVTIEPAL